MTEKRYKLSETHLDNLCIEDNGKILFQKSVVDLLNEQYEIIQQLKQDNNALIRFLENQSIIIQKLHSKLLEHQLKEPIVLTKEDLEIMGKAISYYTHGRCVE